MKHYMRRKRMACRDGFFFAVKEVFLLDQGSQGQESIIQLEEEISLHKQFQHENVVPYLGTDRDDAKLYISSLSL
ncbi:hypothetical protein ACS0TY_018191 [Phlomoides rotata]